MRLWAIADPHLSFSTNKPMDVFGERWKNHEERLARAWRSVVSSDDVVVLPGDISWAINLNEAEADLRFLHELPGQKIIGRGNHDYWWTSLKKMNTFADAKGLDSLTFMRHDAYRFGDHRRNLVVCGTRGWLTPEDSTWQESTDRKIYLREESRLRLSLNAAQNLCNEASQLLVALHYPPFNRSLVPTLFTELLHEFSVDICLYGHVHGVAAASTPEGLISNLRYTNVSADHLGFQPLLIWDSEADRDQHD